MKIDQYGEIELPVAVHDSTVYGLVIAGTKKRVTLFMECARGPSKFAELVFEEVLAHALKNINPGNIADSLCPVDPARFIEKHGEWLASRSRSHGWPQEFKSPEQFKSLIVDGGYTVCVLEPVVGMSGWVIAKTVTGIPMEQRKAL